LIQDFLRDDFKVRVIPCMKWTLLTLMVAALHQIWWRDVISKMHVRPMCVCSYNCSCEHSLFFQPKWVRIGCKAISQSHHSCSICACHYANNSKFVQNPNKLYFAKIWKVNCHGYPHHHVGSTSDTHIVCGWLTKLTKKIVVLVYLVHETWQCCCV